MRFLVDVMCGGVVSSLRMCGYDTSYAGDRDLEADEAILAVADDEDRTIVTRDVALSERATDAIRLESRDSGEQLAALERTGVELDLPDEPQRCGRCNGPLERVSDESVETPEYAPEIGDEPVWRCTACGQYFWKGSHWDDVAATLARVSSAGGPRDGGTAVDPRDGTNGDDPRDGV